MTDNSGVPWMLDNKQMNRIQIAIHRGESMGVFLEAARVPGEMIPEVAAFWDTLAAELAKPLPKGHYWDVIAD